jgi:hypothetical protein
MLQIDDLLARVEGVQSDLMERISECRRENGLEVVYDKFVFDVAEYSRILRIRAGTARASVDRKTCEQSRRRSKSIAVALDQVLSCQELQRPGDLRLVCLDSPPDVSFLLWLGAETYEFIAGYESRDATKITFARGKEFFGADWEPPPETGASKLAGR